ncbi:MAG TPA: hypothetical protein VF559_01600 [Caulobacteraceae bacterium]|jgi:hypothetical protein
MRTVVFGGVAAALAGLVFGAGMKAPVAGRDLPQPELQQVSYPVETLVQDSLRPEYVVASAYAPAGWANGQLWQAAYAAPTDASAQLEPPAPEAFTADEPALNADLADPQADAQAPGADPTMPYASGMTTRSEATQDQAPQARPASSWPNKSGEAKQQVFNGHDGFEHLRPAVAADAAA